MTPLIYLATCCYRKATPLRRRQNHARTNASVMRNCRKHFEERAGGQRRLMVSRYLLLVRTTSNVGFICAHAALFKDAMRGVPRLDRQATRKGLENQSQNTDAEALPQNQ